VGLAQLIRFLLVELNHTGSNLKFDMCVIFMNNYSLVRDDVPVDSGSLLVADFMNIKIKPTQSFRGAHRGKVCVYVFIGMSACTCINIYIYAVFLKKHLLSMN
jgi:hypothetical protein